MTTLPRYYQRDHKRDAIETAILVYGSKSIFPWPWMQADKGLLVNGEPKSLWDYARFICAEYGIESPSDMLLKEILKLTMANY